MKKGYKYNPSIVNINGGQFFDVQFKVWNKGSQTVSFRTYNEAKEFFNAIPLS